MRKLNTPEDFWKLVETNNRSNGCRHWLGSVGPKGYGHFGFTVRANGKTTRGWQAHRLAWYLTNGPIPEGHVVCHKCDNPSCCRIDHLFLGTKSENMQDCLKKGRHYTQAPGFDWHKHRS